LKALLLSLLLLFLLLLLMLPTFSLVHVQFSTSDALTAEKQAEARTLAVENAKAIAKQLAEVKHVLSMKKKRK
jgi:hypothetical protein